MLSTFWRGSHNHKSAGLRGTGYFEVLNKLKETADSIIYTPIIDECLCHRTCAPALHALGVGNAGQVIPPFPFHLLLDRSPNIGPLISRWELQKFKNC
jgi:hypothetical protein